LAIRYQRLLVEPPLAQCYELRRVNQAGEFVGVLAVTGAYWTVAQ